MINTLSMAHRITVHRNNNTLNSLPCSMLLNLLLCLLRTIILTTLHKHTISSHSMVRSNPRSNSKLLNLLLMDTVCPLISSSLMADHHSSGQVHLRMLAHHLMHNVVVVAFTMPEAVMKHLSWALQFVWVLITIEEVVTWPKRAVASLNSIQTIKLHLLPSLSHRIKVIHHRTFMADNVHHLIPIHTTLALIGVEET
jgi:hypothetical protein